MSKPTYGEYLRLSSLLSSQSPRTDEHDELQFIITHQVFELWFRLILHEIDGALSRLEAGHVRGATRSLGRITEVVRFFPGYVRLLETMRPSDFHRFRGELGSASGLQSDQFRQVELSSGLAEEPSFVEFVRGRGLWTDEMERRLKGNNLRRATRGVIEGVALEEIHARPDDHAEVHAYLEACTDYDESFLSYRFAHLQMVQRVIGGGAVGTGGMGAPYLQGTLKHRFFPDLWKVRDRITKAGGGKIAGPGPEGAA